MYIAVGRPLNASRMSPGVPYQQTVGCKKRHLRVIGNERLSADRVQLVLLNPPVPISGKDRFLAHKLHRIAQRVSHRAAKETAANLVQLAHKSPCRGGARRNQRPKKAATKLP